MKAYTILFMFICTMAWGQPKKVTERVEVTGQERLDLDFAFASNITFETWDRQEVRVEVEVEINGGEDNDLFSMSSHKTANSIYVEMDEDLWKSTGKKKERGNNCSFTSKINYKVWLPKGLRVEANTISGDFEFDYFGAAMNLKTISGTIDVTVPVKYGFDFNAKTISGEVYSDIDIQFPNRKEGLRQIVGQDFKGRINQGGTISDFETISGNIYLRKG